MGAQQSRKAVSKHHYKQKSFASESELNNYLLITPETTKTRAITDLDVKFDSITIDRINSHHYLLKHIWKGNFSSPIRHLFEDEMINALEIQCGPATWVLDMATDYPRCSLTGVDATQIFPTEIKPKNTKFVLANQPGHLPFPPSTFSYIRINFVEHMYDDEHLFCHNNIINEVVKIMKSGGWLEISTWSLELQNSGKTTQRLISAIQSCFENYVPVSEMVSSLRCEELKDVNILTNYIPIGKWDGVIGELVLQDLLFTFKKYGEEICNKLDIAPRKYDLYLDEFVKEIEEHKTVFKTYRFYGQKNITI